MGDNVATLKIGTGFSKEAIESISQLKQEPEWLRARRLEAWHLYEETPMPAPNDELWRRTPLTTLKLDSIIPFAPAGEKQDFLSQLPLKFQDA